MTGNNGDHIDQSLTGNLEPQQAPREFVYEGRTLFYLPPRPDEGMAPSDSRVDYFMCDEAELRDAIDGYKQAMGGDISKLPPLRIFNDVVVPALLNRVKEDNAAALEQGKAVAIRTKTISIGPDLTYTYKPRTSVLFENSFGTTHLPALATLLQQGDSRPNPSLNVTWVAAQTEYMNKHTGERLGFGTYDLAEEGVLHPEGGHPELFDNAFVALMTYDQDALEQTAERYTVRFREDIDRAQAIRQAYVVPRVNFY